VYSLVNRLAASAALREQEGYTFDNVAEADVKGFGRRAATADEAKAWNRAHPGEAAKYCKEHPGQELQLVAHHRDWGITQRGTRKLFLVPLPHKVVKKGDAYPGESWEEVRPGVQRLRACAKGTVFCTDGAKAYAQGKTKKATKKMPKGIKHETVDHYNNQYVRFAKVHFNVAHAISKKRKIQVGTQKIESTWKRLMRPMPDNPGQELRARLHSAQFFFMAEEEDRMEALGRASREQRALGVPLKPLPLAWS